MDNSNDQVFRPPSQFIKSSEARIARLRQLQEERQQQQQQQQQSTENSVDTSKSPGQRRKSSGATAIASPPPRFRMDISATEAIPSRASPIPIQSKNINNNSVASSPSKTVQEIDQIRQAREERRAVQAEFKKIKEGLDDMEHEILGYRFLIDKFREQLTLETQPVRRNDPSAKNTELQDPDGLIQVCVRKRPLNKRELDVKYSGQFDVITTPEGISSRQNAILYVHEPKSKFDLTKSIDNHTFQFDNVIDENVTNEQLYQTAVRRLVEILFKTNGRATLFAYGQTGSGKTFTVFGHESSNTQGIYHYIGEDVFRMLDKVNDKRARLGLYCSFFEIYGGHVYDLLNLRSRVSVLENKQGYAQLNGITEAYVSGPDAMKRFLEIGQRSRSTGATDANPESSRSHAIFQLSLKQIESSAEPNAPNSSQPIGQFSLIDLAGSEKASEANASNRQTRIEGAEINKSLLALKECIRALGNPNAKHVPFRASKLTKILKDSLDINRTDRQSNSLNHMVVMIATVSPNSDSVEHTLNTLRYANRVKEFRSSRPSFSLPKVPGNMVYDPKEMIHRSNSNEKLDSPSTRQVKEYAKQKGGSRRSSTGDLEYTDDLEYLHSRLADEENDPGMKRLHTAVQAVVDDEDALIQAHITSLQHILAISREEEEILLADVSKPGYNLDDYIEGLESALNQKQLIIQQLQKRVANFKANLLNC